MNTKGTSPQEKAEPMGPLTKYLLIARKADPKLDEVSGEKVLAQTLVGATHDESSLPKSTDPDARQCHECNQFFPKDEVYEVGNDRVKEKRYKCKCCNRLAVKVSGIKRKHGHLAQDWAEIPKAEAKEFLRMHADLCASDLAKEMEVRVQMTKKARTTIGNEKKTSKYPLSVYKTQGYSDQALQNIELKCESEWDSQLGEYVYGLNIRSAFVKDEDITENTANFAPKAQSPQRTSNGAGSSSAVPPQPHACKKAATPIEADKPNTTSSDKKMTTQQKHALKKKYRDLIARMAPVEAGLRFSLEKEVGKNCTIKERVPDYILKDSRRMHNVLKDLSANYTDLVEKKEYAKTTMTIKNDEKEVDRAEGLLKSLEAMIEIAKCYGSSHS